MSASSLIQYNRARTSNIEDLTIPIGVSPVLLLEMGIFNPASGSNFLEIIPSIGWFTTRGDVGLVTFEVIVDGTIVGMTDEVHPSGVVDTQTTFETILDNVSQGHHVIQLTASAFLPGFVSVTGPLTMTVSVYA